MDFMLEASFGYADAPPDGALPARPSSPLPPLATITKASPAPELKYQLVELIFAYCYVMRMYNGEPACDLEAAATTALAISPVLTGTTDATQLPASGAQVLLDCIVRATSPPIGSSGDRCVALLTRWHPPHLPCEMGMMKLTVGTVVILSSHAFQVNLGIVLQRYELAKNGSNNGDI